MFDTLVGLGMAYVGAYAMTLLIIKSLSSLGGLSLLCVPVIYWNISQAKKGNRWFRYGMAFMMIFCLCGLWWIESQTGFYAMTLGGGL
jgi:hypothetical protein